MTTSAKFIEKEALSLSRGERVILAIRLIDSIEDRPCDDPQHVEAAWLAEAHRRYEAYQRGEIETIRAEEVFADLRKDDQ